MKWTKRQPKVSGYYWLKQPQRLLASFGEFLSNGFRKNFLNANCCADLAIY